MLKHGLQELHGERIVLPRREGALLKARFRRALLGAKADSV